MFKKEYRHWQWRWIDDPGTVFNTFYNDRFVGRIKLNFFCEQISKNAEEEYVGDGIGNNFTIVVAQKNRHIISSTQKTANEEWHFALKSSK